MHISLTNGTELECGTDCIQHNSVCAKSWVWRKYSPHHVCNKNVSNFRHRSSQCGKEGQYSQRYTQKVHYVPAIQRHALYALRQCYTSRPEGKLAR